MRDHLLAIVDRWRRAVFPRVPARPWSDIALLLNAPDPDRVRLPALASRAVEAAPLGDLVQRVRGPYEGIELQVTKLPRCGSYRIDVTLSVDGSAPRIVPVTYTRIDRAESVSVAPCRWDELADGAAATLLCPDVDTTAVRSVGRPLPPVRLAA